MVYNWFTNAIVKHVYDNRDHLKFSNYLRFMHDRNVQKSYSAGALGFNLEKKYRKLVFSGIIPRCPLN